MYRIECDYLSTFLLPLPGHMQLDCETVVPWASMALMLSSGLARSTLTSMVSKRRKGEEKTKKERIEAGEKGEGGTGSPHICGSAVPRPDQLWRPHRRAT